MTALMYHCNENHDAFVVLAALAAIVTLTLAVLQPPPKCRKCGSRTVTLPRSGGAAREGLFGKSLGRQQYRGSTGSNKAFEYLRDGADRFDRRRQSSYFALNWSESIGRHPSIPITIRITSCATVCSMHRPLITS